MTGPQIPSDYTAIWMHENRGGYGYVDPIPCKVIEARGERVKIEVMKSTGERVTRWVKAEKIKSQEKRE
jgi:hypothetical protein